MKKAVVFLAVLSLLLTACGAEQNDPAGGAKNVPSPEKTELRFAEAEYAGWSLDQYIENSQNVFLGVCTSVTEKEDNVEGVITFRIEEALKGKPDASVTEFRAVSAAPFRTGGEYLIFCSRETSVFSGKEWYGISTVLYDKDDALVHEAIPELAPGSLREACAYVKDFVKDSPAEPDGVRYGDYCRSSSLDEIYEASSNVLTAKITGVLDNSLSDRTQYTFSVTKEYKGKVADEQWIITTKDALEVGREYLLLLNKPDSSASFLMISSRNSIYAANGGEADRIAAIR